MKKILALSILLSLCGRCHAQFFKKLKQQAKEEVDYRVHRKAGQKINEGLDTVLSLPKKVIDKKKKSDAESANANDRTETNATGSNGGKSGDKDAKAAAPGDEEDMSSKDGYVT